MKTYFWIGAIAIAVAAVASFARLRAWERPVRSAHTWNDGELSYHRDVPSIRLVPLENEGGKGESAAPGSKTANLLYARTALTRLLSQYRLASQRLKGVATGNGDSLVWRKEYGFVQSRLLAMCYPEECKELILGILSDNASTSEDIIFSARMLGVLASLKLRWAESELLRLTARPEAAIASLAMDELFAIDKQGEYRAVFWSKCSEGMREAFDLGPYWADVQTKQVLQQISAQYDKPEAPDFRTREALDRMAILESPNREVILEQILSGQPDPGDFSQKVYERTLWALRVVAITPTKNSGEILKKRLEEDEVVAAKFLSTQIVEPPGPTSPGYVHATRDEYYDEILLAYQAMGGKLNQLQTERLTYFGYLGDPKERLNALMGEAGK